MHGNANILLASLTVGTQHPHRLSILQKNNKIEHLSVIEARRSEHTTSPVLSDKQLRPLASRARKSAHDWVIFFLPDLSRSLHKPCRCRCMFWSIIAHGSFGLSSHLFLSLRRAYLWVLSLNTPCSFYMNI